MDTKRRDIHNSDLPILCQSCEARHKGMCGVLDAAELLALSRHTRMVRHAAGEELAAESEPTETYANVMRGVVKLTKMLADGRQQIVGLQFAPDFLGRPFASESAVTAEAASDVDLCHVPKAALERQLAANPRLQHRLMQQTLRELDEARDWMLTSRTQDRGGKGGQLPISDRHAPGSLGGGRFEEPQLRPATHARRYC